jgi:hypothetical protein
MRASAPAQHPIEMGALQRWEWEGGALPPDERPRGQKAHEGGRQTPFPIILAEIGTNPERTEDGVVTHMG